MSEGWVCGTGFGNFPKPGDPDSNVILKATPAFGGIDVEWTYPAINPHAVAHTILYRSTSPDVDSATRHAIVAGNFFYDKTTTATLIEYYYWIEIVSVNGTVSERIGPAFATARPNIDQMIEMLSGQIDDGVLAQSLKTRIAQLDVLDGRLQEETVARIAGEEAMSEAYGLLQEDVEGVSTKVDAFTVEFRDANSAMASAVNAVHALAEGTQAGLLSEITARADGDKALATRIDAMAVEADDMRALIQSESSARVSADEAAAQQISTLAVFSDETAAALKTEAQLRTNADNALGLRIDSMAVETGDLSAALLQEQSIRASKDEALATDIVALRAASTKTDAAVLAEAHTRAAQDTALASAIESISARLNSMPIWASNFEPGSDFDRWKTKGGGSIAAVETGYAGEQAAIVRHTGTAPYVSGTTGSVYATVSDSMALNFNGKRVRITGYAKRPSSGNATEFAVAYSTSAGSSGWQRFPVSGQWTLFEFLWDVPANGTGAAYIGLWGDTSGTGKGVLLDLINIQPATSEEDLPAITAAIQTESKARVAADAALASQIATAQTTFGNNIASVQQTFETRIQAVNNKVTEIGALWTAKVDVNGLIGGFGVYNDGKQVEAGFDVDRFWVGRTTNKKKPFIIQNGEVFINQAVIANASINSAKIANGAIQVAHIQDGSITAAKIKDASITNAKIGSVIQSDAKDSAGRPAWLLGKDGMFQLNGTGSNGRIEQRNNYIKVFDASNRVRVQIGELNA